MKRLIKKKFDIRAFTYAIMLLFNSICLVGNELFKGKINFGTYFMLFIIGCFFISVFPLKKMLLLKNVFLLIAVLGVYELTAYMQFKLSSYIISFIVWTVLAMLISMRKFDIKSMFNISLFISGITMVLGVWNVDAYEDMTWSYSVFPCIAVTFTHFYLYRKGSKIWMKLVYIIGIITVSVYIFFSNRGGLVSLLCLVFLLTTRKTKKMKSKKRVLLTIAFIVSLFITVFYVEDMIIQVYELLKTYNIEIDAISKTYRMILQDNVTNNREELYRFAWYGFLDHPLAGHKIGAFSVYHGGWPHNILLQLLYEGGIPLTVIVLTPVIVTGIKMFTTKEIDSRVYIMFVLLFSIAVPRLLFTSEVWNTQSYWMLMVFCLMPKVLVAPKEKTDENKDTPLSDSE